MLKIVIPLIGVMIISLSGCTHWATLWEKLIEEKSSSYCIEHYNNKEKREQCTITYSALQRDKKECKRFTHPEYCLILAKYSWENYIQYGIKGRVTKEDAYKYPIIYKDSKTIK
jgi:hypothetical protein